MGGQKMKRYLSILLILVLVLSVAIVAAPTTPVKAQGTIINVPADQPTIADAITAAVAGDTINVAAGTYNENVVVNKQLTIVGAGSANTTVSAAIPANPSSPVFHVTANNTRIQDFTITGATGSMGILLAASSCAIRSNTVSGNNHGIWIAGTADNRIYRNTITGNTIYGIYLPGITGHNAVIYNDITGNGSYGVHADQVPGEPGRWQGASLNWWGDASGPGGQGPGTGDPVNRVWFNPWLNVPISSTFASGVADVSIGIDLQVGWNSLSTPLELDGDSNQWNEIVARSNLTYDAAYIYDPDTGWAPLITTDATYIGPLDAVLIQVSSPAMVSMKVSTAPNCPATRVLKAGWNLIGTAIPQDRQELEMWKVLISVAHTSTGLIGYDMVVSPPLVGQQSWVYVRGEEQETDFAWQTMHFGRGYWIYMENQDELAGFTSTPLGARVWD